jgi:uracil-DNA glycosylase family 4
MAAKKPKPEPLDVEKCHVLSCKACPLNEGAGMRHPKMPASGTDKPGFYILGEAPGKEEDFRNTQFVGRSGQLLRRYLPRDWLPAARFNNCLQCLPSNGANGVRGPEEIELECCRPRVAKDIERTRPPAVFAFGAVPLKWAAGEPMVSSWRGRRLPIQIGHHSSWLYSFNHPAYILRTQSYSSMGSEEERAFAFDIKRALAEINALPKPVVYNEIMARSEIECVDGKAASDCDRIIRFLERAGDEPYAGVDYETVGRRPYNRHNTILSAAVSIPGQTLAFPFDHPEAQWDDADYARLSTAWHDFLVSPCRKIAHNLSFEGEWSSYFFGAETLRPPGGAIEPLWEDTMAQAYVLDERKGVGRPGCLGLDFLSVQYFGFHLKSLSEVDVKKLATTPLDEVLAYNGMDAKFCRLLYMAQSERLEADGLVDVYRMHLRRIPTAVFTQLKGLPVHQPTVERLAAKYGRQIATVDGKISKLPVVQQFEQMRRADKREKKPEFNPASNTQLVTIFRDMLHRPEGFEVKRRGRQPKDPNDRPYSVAEEQLSKMHDPLARLILERRGVSKLLSTYVEPLRVGSEILFDDGCLHPQLHTLFTSTGRASCLVGRTPIYVLDPRGTVPVSKIRKGDWVWAFDADKRPVPEQVAWSGQTGFSSQLARLTYRTQGARTTKVIICTPEHLFRLRDGTYRRADELRPRDRLLSLEREVKRGYRYVYATGGFCGRENRMVLGLGKRLKGGHHGHHIDETSLNNVPSNLEKLLPVHHSLRHPWTAEKRAKVRRTLKALRKSNPELWPPAYGEQNPNWRPLTKIDILTGLKRAAWRPTLAAVVLGVDLGRLMNRMRLFKIDWRARRLAYKSKRNMRGESIEKLLPAASKATTLHEAARILGVNFYRARELLASDSNHEVMSVEIFRRKVPVYDLKIPKHHNFIANGVCVHNSSDPNEQNFPTESEVRSQIRPPEGFVIVSWDFGQIEARVIAMATLDPRYTKALWDRVDIHMRWAKIWAKHHPRIMKRYEKKADPLTAFRKDIKNIWTFPLFFGALLESVAGYMQVSPSVVKPLYNDFWREFIGVKRWQNKVIEFYHEHGYVETLTGRRRRAPIETGQIINTPIQGTTADIVFDAMNRLSETGNPLYQAAMMIHDDLTYFLPLEGLEGHIDIINRELVRPTFDFISVPLTVELKMGADWEKMETLGEVSSDQYFERHEHHGYFLEADEPGHVPNAGIPHRGSAVSHRSH